jgi:hypothetical protein
VYRESGGSKGWMDGDVKVSSVDFTLYTYTGFLHFVSRCKTQGSTSASCLFEPSRTYISSSISDGIATSTYLP